MKNLHSTKRYPWIAAFLSLLMPGLGQLYCGAFFRCLCFIVLCSGAGMFGILALIPQLDLPGTVLALIEGGSMSAYVIGVIDAWRVARRTTDQYQLKEYNRWYAYLMLYVAISGGHLFSMLYARDHLIQPFKAGSASMYPTIWTGDQVMAAKNTYDTKDPMPGDIILFRNPNNRRQVFVKRVIAVGGEAVEILDGDVYVNGSKLTREPAAVPTRRGARREGAYFMEENRGASYVIYLNGKHPRWQNLPRFVVPAHACFVLGDNRDDSLDSRNFGPIPVVGILGKVVYRYAPLTQIGSVTPTEAPRQDVAPKRTITSRSSRRQITRSLSKESHPRAGTFNLVRMWTATSDGS